MTGHLNYWSEANTNARNQQIRDFCIANDKILYDFADIESYDPGQRLLRVRERRLRATGARSAACQGNWAQNWQSCHVVGVDWYQCGAAHTEPLNANQKAYCAWWLWARLGGWPACRSRLIVSG